MQSKLTKLDASVQIMATGPQSAEEVCQRLRSLVQDALGKHLHSAAIFYADKLVTLSGRNPADVYLLAQAFFVGRHYRRALDMLLQGEYVDLDVRFRYLAARCLAECQRWDECLSLIGDGAEGEPPSVTALRHPPGSLPPSAGREIDLYSSICLLRGHVFAALDNMEVATRWYRAALASDPYNSEAFEAVTSHHVLTCAEEVELVEGLGIPQQDRWLSLAYRVSCKKFSGLEDVEGALAELEAPAGPTAAAGNGGRRGSEGTAMDTDGTSTPPPPTNNQRPQPNVNQRGATAARGPGQPGQAPSASGAPPGAAGAGTSRRSSGSGGGGGGGGWGLSENLDIQSCRADLYFHRGQHRECRDLARRILDRDPHHPRAILLVLAAAHELRRKDDLFLLAHRLVDEDPDGALPWYAVGCYYMCTGQYESARKYLQRATVADPRFAPAWIGFGNAFAALDEADQAMAAYRTAARLFPGLHLPLLGIGMEHLRTNNLALAEQAFRAARDLCPTDATVLNELGVAAFRAGDYSAAADQFERAIRCIPSMTEDWEATLVNYGHALRKLRRFPEAREQYSRALSLSPMAGSVIASLAYTLHLEGRVEDAIEAYHRALAVRPDDPFASDMLGVALAAHCELIRGQSVTELGIA